MIRTGRVDVRCSDCGCWIKAAVPPFPPQEPHWCSRCAGNRMVAAFDKMFPADTKEKS